MFNVQDKTSLQKQGEGKYLIPKAALRDHELVFLEQSKTFGFSLAPCGHCTHGIPNGIGKGKQNSLRALCARHHEAGDVAGLGNLEHPGISSPEGMACTRQ